MQSYTEQFHKADFFRRLTELTGGDSRPVVLKTVMIIENPDCTLHTHVICKTIYIHLWAWDGRSLTSF